MQRIVETRVEWRRLGAVERAQCLVAAALLVAPLLLAWMLSPDPRGHGTHEQLGLPPCVTMQLFGVPCLFCGMTTSFAWFAHGHPLHALTVQPAAAVFALLMLCGSVAAGACGACGSLPMPGQRRWIAAGAKLAGAIVVAAWIYKVAMTVAHYH